MSQVPISQLPSVPQSDVRSTSRLVLDTTDANGVAYTGTISVSDFLTGALGGGVFQSSLSIPSASVLTANATPIAFGITCPTGYYVKVLAVDMNATYASAAYATNTNIHIRTVGVTDAQAKGASFLSFSANTFTPFNIETGAANGVTFVDGADVEFFVATGNPTAGDSDITIYLTYRLCAI